MKTCLLIIFCTLNIHLFGQVLTDSTAQQNFTTEDVQFSNSGDTLSGTIFKPSISYTSVVLVHGSGQEKRMTGMASLLAKNGITVFTYDKRGAGKSGGIYAGPEVGTNNIDRSNLQLLASDASAACDALLAHLPANHGTVGLIGFSQAGWIIPMAAKRNPKINFMVIFSGPVVNTLQQLRFQFYTAGDSAFWEKHTEAEAREHVRSDPDRYQFTGTDPQDALRRLSIPGLWLFGTKDIQIPIGMSKENLDKLRSRGKAYQYFVFEEFGHNTSSLKSPKAIMAAIQWIKAGH